MCLENSIIFLKEINLQYVLGNAFLVHDLFIWLVDK
jgi:hypothetical protein